MKDEPGILRYHIQTGKPGIPNPVSLPYRVIDLEQGTAEWHAWRSQGIGSSDAPIIMGENRWKNRGQLLRDKRDRIVADSNPAMIRGTELEPEARKKYQELTEIPVHPVCLQSTRYSWLRASLDGISDSGKAIVEIKCGESIYRLAASTRQVPVHYGGQLQHILAVTDSAEMDFFCYWPNRPAIRLRVQRNQRYIDRLLRVEQMFWEDYEKMRAYHA